MSIFFTSDTHYSHSNVIKYSNRPFKDAQEMNRAMIDNWNSVVTENDEVYVLGDLIFKDNLDDILRQLKFKNVYHIKGNHDHRNPSSIFTWSRDYFELKVPDRDASRGEQLICLFHYPIEEWNKAHYGSWHCHGHVHGKFEKNIHKKRVDVGVDVWNYTPVSYEQLKEYFKDFDNTGFSHNRE